MTDEIDPGSIACERPAADKADEIAARALAGGDLPAVADYLERFVLPTMKLHDGIFHSTITLRALIDLMRVEGEEQERLLLKPSRRRPPQRNKTTKDSRIGAWIHRRIEEYGADKRGARISAIGAAMDEFRIRRSKADECLDDYRARFEEELQPPT
jgi:hypothetical protein